MRIGGRVRLAIVGLGLALAVGIAAPSAAADAPPIKVINHNARSFKIPITINPIDRPRLKEIQLWVSTDAGASWQPAGQTTPDDPSFTFRAPDDGEYWFASRTLDLEGRASPSNDRPAEPGMKVVVDTVPPTVTLEPQARTGSRASVRWEVQDNRPEDLKLDSLRLEYRAEGASDWAQVPIRRAARIGAETWDAGTANRVKVRMAVKDLAGNVGSAEITLGDGIASEPGAAVAGDPRDFAPPPPIKPIAARAPAQPAANADDGFIEPDAPPRVAARPRPAPTPAPAPSGPPTLVVGSPRFPLRYEVEDPGPNGPALVELWATRDGGRTWRRLPEDADRTSPYDVDLGGPGTFGLWLVVQGATNQGDPPPAPGDRPQTWVEVDTTGPEVKLDPPRVGVGKNAGKVLITWTASDPHLAEKPVVLSYRADAPEAPWQPITGRIDNNGRHVWSVPPGAPARLHVRIDVVDALGNRSSAETTDTGRAVIVDRSRPKGRILGLDPGARGVEMPPRR